MSQDSKSEKGRAAAKRLMGEKQVEYVERFLEGTNPAFREFVMECFSTYDREMLDIKTRSAITIGVVTALGRMQELAVHARAGLNIGLSEEQIREIIMQVAIYAGVPVAAEAYTTINKVFKKTEQEQ